MAVYPFEWESSEEFDKIGRIIFRPVKESDEHLLTEFFYSLAAEDASTQFLPGMRDLPVCDIRSIADIDYSREMYLLGLIAKAGAERIVVLARYLLDEQSMTAEVDLAAQSRYARGGVVIPFMLRQLAEKCRSRDIKTLIFYVSVGSERIFEVFQELDRLVEITMSGDVYEIRLHLDQPAQTGVLRKP